MISLDSLDGNGLDGRAVRRALGAVAVGAFASTGWEDSDKAITESCGSGKSRRDKPQVTMASE